MLSSLNLASRWDDHLLSLCVPTSGLTWSLPQHAFSFSVLGFHGQVRPQGAHSAKESMTRAGKPDCEGQVSRKVSGSTREEVRKARQQEAGSGESGTEPGEAGRVPGLGAD